MLGSEERTTSYPGRTPRAAPPQKAGGYLNNPMVKSAAVGAIHGYGLGMLDVAQIQESQKMRIAIMAAVAEFGAETASGLIGKVITIPEEIANPLGSTAGYLLANYLSPSDSRPMMIQGASQFASSAGVNYLTSM